MNNCVIIVPVYKVKPNYSEQASFKQVLTILYNHHITLITYKDLDLSIYENIAKQTNKTFSIEFFDKFYFDSINGYNELCLSKNFYKRFNKHKYMLIYQLDAWVFRDELDYWCDKGYDYIGAPWFSNWGTHENGKLWEVGNGGFSLRKISYFYNLLSYKWPLSHQINIKDGIKSFIKSILFSLGYHNTILWHIDQNKYINEDILLSFILNKHITTKRKLTIKKPNTKQAAYFAFEKSPTYLYNLCNNSLPFGCHAYKKNEFESFWHKYIKENETNYNNNKS